MLAMDRCSSSAAARNASFSPGSIRKVNVVVLVVAIVLPDTAFVLWIYCTVQQSSEASDDHASTKVNKLRKRLGWQAGIFNGDGGKPKGMHWMTYQRLKSRHDALAQVSLQDISRKLGFLHELLKR